MTGSFAGVLVVFVGFWLALLALRLAGSLRSVGMSTWPERVPVLGGGAPFAHAWSRFHARYYLMTLVFLVFDMEMVFMYPWAVVFVREGLKAMIEMGMFLIILSLGLVYAAREGAFRWQ